MESFYTRQDIMLMFCLAVKKHYSLDLNELDLLINKCHGSPYDWIKWDTWTELMKTVVSEGEGLLADWVKIGNDTFNTLSNPILAMAVNRLTVRQLLKLIPLHFEKAVEHTQVEFHSDSCKSGTLFFKTRPEILAAHQGFLPFYHYGCIQGLLQFKGVQVEIKIQKIQTELKMLLEDYYSRFNLHPVSDDKGLWIGGKLIAERVESRNTLLKVREDLEIDGQVLIRKGEIYGAPRSVLTLNWKRQKSWYRLLHFWKTLISLKHAGELYSATVTDLSGFTKQTALKLENQKYTIRPELTKRENEVAALLIQGKKRRQIASDLNISLSTVKRHVESIYRKLEVSSIYELISLARVD